MNNDTPALPKEITPYKLADTTSYTANQLGHALAAHWEEGKKHLARGFIQKWMGDCLHDYHLVSFTQDLLEQGLDGDLALTRLIRKIAPEIEPTWNGSPLDEKFLADLANQSLQNNDSAIRLVRSLNRQKILAEWPSLCAVNDKWAENQRNFVEAWDDAEFLGASAESKPRADVVLALLLRAICDAGEYAKQVEFIRTGISRPIRACPFIAPLLQKPFNPGIYIAVRFLSAQAELFESSRLRKLIRTKIAELKPCIDNLFKPVSIKTRLASSFTEYELKKRLLEQLAEYEQHITTGLDDYELLNGMLVVVHSLLVNIQSNPDEFIWHEITKAPSDALYSLYVDRWPKGSNAHIAKEWLHWQSIQGGRDPAELENFLSLWPKGENEASAFKRLAQLKKEEQDDYRQVVESPGERETRYYLERWPNSSHAPKLRKALSARLRKKLPTLFPMLLDPSAWMDYRKYASPEDKQLDHRAFGLQISMVIILATSGFYGVDFASQLYRKNQCLEERSEPSCVGYLGKWPDGRYAPLVRDGLDGIQQDQSWQTCQQSGELSCYQNYTSRWPSGKHTLEAGRVISAIQERVAWSKCESSPSQEPCLEYLKNWPQGSHIDASRARLDNLRETQTWAECETAKKIDACTRYLAEWPDGRYKERIPLAVDAHNEQQTFNDCTVSGKPDACQAYLQTWPNGAYLAKVNEQIDTNRSESILSLCLQGNLSHCMEYLRAWPGKSGAFRADEEIKLSCTSGSISAICHEYVKLTPHRRYDAEVFNAILTKEATEREQARKEESELSWHCLELNQADACEKYTNRWPGNPKAKTAREILNKKAEAANRSVQATGPIQKTIKASAAECNALRQKMAAAHKNNVEPEPHAHAYIANARNMGIENRYNLINQEFKEKCVR